MMNDDIYSLCIDAYTPESIPMARLAEYVAALAQMLGEKHSVHFEGLKSGSTVISCRVEKEAAPKVRENLEQIAANDDSELAEAFRTINELARKDNAHAILNRADHEILEFPGIKQIRPPKLGPFNQAIAKEGILIRVGGKDKTAHAILEDSEGKTWSFAISRDLAKELATHLYGNPIQLRGNGKAFRDEDGRWHYDKLKADEFSELRPDKLSAAVNQIRNLPADTWNQTIDSMTLIKSLRNDEDGES